MRRYKTTQCETCGIDILATSRGKYCKQCSYSLSIERNKIRFQANYDAGLCRCGRDRASNSMCVICAANRKKNAPKYLASKRAQSVEYRIRIKHQVFDFYGNACACCGDTTFEFLSVDHVGGWGKDHLKPSGERYGGLALYTWIVKHGFPGGFRLLCGSCHYAVSYHGYCPHERERQANAAMLQSTQASNPDVVM